MWQVLLLELRDEGLPVMRATFLQMDALNISFENEFDVIGAFDVIEYIEEDEVKYLQRKNHKEKNLWEKKLYVFFYN